MAAHGKDTQIMATLGADMLGHSAQDEEIGQHIDHIDGFQFAIDTDRQTLARELVDNIEHAISRFFAGEEADQELLLGR